jgi:hypothetical protein
MKKINEIRKQKKKYTIFLILIWIINCVLLIFSVYHFFYNGNKLVIDKYFIGLLFLNIISFYGTYKIADQLHFLKYQFNHFNNLKES